MKRTAGQRAKSASIGMVTVIVAVLVVFMSRKPPAEKGPEKGKAPAPIVTAESKPATGASALDASTPKSEAAMSSPDMPFGVHVAPAKTPGMVRVTTWNIENLYDDVDDPENGWADELKLVKPKAHRDAAGEVIRRLDPDVLALEEVESEAAVRWFLREQKLDETYPFVVSLDAGDGRGIEQAVVSKFPLSNAKVWAERETGMTHPETLADGSPNPDAGKPIKMARSPLMVDVRVPATVANTPEGTSYVFTLFVIHAKADRKYAFQREAEAAKHLELIEGLMKESPQRNLMVLGDFNARKGDTSFQIYTSALTDVFGDVRLGDPRSQTHVTNRIIDHVLVSPSMKPEIAEGGRFVLAAPLPPRNAPFEGPKPAGYVSDHLPVSVEVRPVEGK